MKRLLGLAFDSFPTGRFGVALLILRASFGIAFIVHGFFKLADLDRFAAANDLSGPVALAAAVTQFVGGILLVVGILTPFAALAISITMVAATVLLIRQGETYLNPDGHSWESAAFFALTGFVIALVGPGRYSVDAGVFGSARLATRPQGSSSLTAVASESPPRNPR